MQQIWKNWILEPQSITWFKWVIKGVRLRGDVYIMTIDYFCFALILRLTETMFVCFSYNISWYVTNQCWLMPFLSDWVFFKMPF